MRDMFYLSSSFFLKGQILYTSIKYLSSSIFSLEGQIRYIGVTYLPPINLISKVHKPSNRQKNLQIQKCVFRSYWEILGKVRISRFCYIQNLIPSTDAGTVDSRLLTLQVFPIAGQACNSTWFTILKYTLYCHLSTVCLNSHIRQLHFTLRLATSTGFDSCVTGMSFGHFQYGKRNLGNTLKTVYIYI